MGCFSSKQVDDSTADDNRNPVTNAVSPESNISTARHAKKFEFSERAAGWGETMSISPPAARPQTRRSTSKARPHTVVGGFDPPEISGQPTVPPPPTSRSRRESAFAQPDEAPKPHHPPSEVEPSALGGSLLAGPDTKVPHASNDSTLPIRYRLELDKLWDALPSVIGKLSKRLDDLDRTGQLTERTKPRFNGGFSDVSQAKLEGRVVAVKALRVANIEGGESQMWKRLGREVYIWAALDHPNVLELLGFAFEDETPCLISPWCEHGTVLKYLEKFPDANRRRLVREIAEGLKYLHEQTPPIIHGDFKTSNVCVTDKHEAKICDFGSSRRVDQRGTGFTTSGAVPTSTRYDAPEILEYGQNPTLLSDVFSFAYVALETMSGKSPFWWILKDVAILNQVVHNKQTPSPKDHPGVEEATWELLRKCWTYDPSNRPKMVDVCQTLDGAEYGSTTTPEGATSPGII